MITVKVDDRILQRRLKHIEESMGPSGRAQILGDIGEQMVEEVKRRIAGNRAWGGGDFAPNTAVTLSKKRGSKPLVDSGIFVSTRLFYHVTGDAVTIGANGDQAAVLQFGARQGQFGRTRRNGPIPWGNIPARAYLPLDGNQVHPEARALVLTTIEEYVDSIAKS